MLPLLRRSILLRSSILHCYLSLKVIFSAAATLQVLRIANVHVLGPKYPAIISAHYFDDLLHYLFSQNRNYLSVLSFVPHAIPTNYIIFSYGLPPH
jgi:hypothetical protein